MRVSTAAIYTLVALTAKELSQTAIATPVPETLSEGEAAETSARVQVAVTAADAAVVPPEHLALERRTRDLAQRPNQLEHELGNELGLSASWTPEANSEETVAQAETENLAVASRSGAEMTLTPMAIAPPIAEPMLERSTAVEPLNAIAAPNLIPMGSSNAPGANGAIAPLASTVQPIDPSGRPSGRGSAQETQEAQETAGAAVASVTPMPLQLQSTGAQTNLPSAALDWEVEHSLQMAAILPGTTGHWAEPFIDGLAAADIVVGYTPDGAFRPDAQVTRAQYATMIANAFPQTAVRAGRNFADVPANHWAQNAIQAAYRMGFLSGISDREFAPEQSISRTDAVVALAQGLRLASNPEAIANLSNTFRDADQILGYARAPVAAATTAGVVVNYPNVDLFRPSQAATRADAAALVYQALVQQGRLPSLAAEPSIAPYLVGNPNAASPDIEVTALPQSAAVTEIPDRQELEELQQQLQQLPEATEGTDFGDVYEGSPAITVANPSGFGADDFTGFVNFGYQSRVRFSDKDDATAGIGIGFGDARENLGVQLSYTLASFGTNRDFGTGGFNLKLHRQFGDGWGAALGWEGFLNIGDDNDFEDTVYGSISRVFRTRPDIDDAFSRVALTAGLGNGRFRSAEDIDDDEDSVNVFGSAAVRIAQPVSAIVEWTGQDLALGLSIVPFRNIPLVITPALRDVAGAGDGARFVLGTGISFQF